MNDVWLKELAEEQTKRLLEYYIKYGGNAE